MAKWDKRRTLPRKPSDLILLALKDFGSVERSVHYEVNMDEWHNPFDFGTCAVCMAGAVMARTLNVNPLEKCNPDDFTDGTKNKLIALDHLRTGSVGSAFELLGRRYEKGALFDRTIVPYYFSTVQFKRQMRKLSNNLARAGY